MRNGKQEEEGKQEKEGKQEEEGKQEKEGKGKQEEERKEEKRTILKYAVVLALVVLPLLPPLAFTAVREMLWGYAAVLVLAGFLPLMAFSYYFFRRQQRLKEIERILEVLTVSQKCKESFCKEDEFLQFLAPVTLATLLSCLGLTAVILGAELGLAEHPSLLLGGAHLSGVPVSDPELAEYQQGAFLVFCLAFLGAYFWALQDVFRCYSVSNLRPSAYYSLSLRMIFACVIALLVYHAADAVGFLGIIERAEGGASEGMMASMLPALAFLIGSFPQRGLQWLQQRFTIFRRSGDPSVRDLPLSMIEGMTVHDELVFGELGIDDCYDLATADFIPLLFRTHYPARELIDWLLQAKLCVAFGAGVRELRQRGLRTVVDLKGLRGPAIRKLATETSVTEQGLRRVVKEVRHDPDIARLCEAAHRVSEYWVREDGVENRQPHSLLTLAEAV